tara:strand:+ start:430 stop:669 length:240 start_codon:yes stop_codon:yes gene_type:complete
MLTTSESWLGINLLIISITLSIFTRVLLLPLSSKGIGKKNLFLERIFSIRKEPGAPAPYTIGSLKIEYLMGYSWAKVLR